MKFAVQSEIEGSNIWRWHKYLAAGVVSVWRRDILYHTSRRKQFTLAYNVRLALIDGQRTFLAEVGNGDISFRLVQIVNLHHKCFSVRFSSNRRLLRPFLLFAVHQRYFGRTDFVGKYLEWFEWINNPHDSPMTPELIFKPASWLVWLDLLRYLGKWSIGTHLVHCTLLMAQSPDGFEATVLKWSIRNIADPTFLKTKVPNCKLAAFPSPENSPCVVFLPSWCSPAVSCWKCSFLFTTFPI